MFARIADRNDLYSVIKQDSNFVMRKHGAFLLYSIYAFTIGVTITIFSVIYHLKSFYQNESPATLFINISIIIFIFIALCIYNNLIIKRIRHILHKTEFQNALFADIARRNSEFFFIVNNEKKIIYADRNAQSIFQRPSLDKLEDIFVHKGFHEDDKDRLENAIKKNKETTIPFRYTDKQGHDISINVNLRPTTRPSGYLSIQGYIPKEDPEDINKKSKK